MIFIRILSAALEAPVGLPTTDPSPNTITTVLSFAFGLAGAIALLIIAVAGLKYTISRGDANAIKNSKETIIYAVVGLVIAMAGYSIVNFVFHGVKK